MMVHLPRPRPILVSHGSNFHGSFIISEEKLVLPILDDLPFQIRRIRSFALLDNRRLSWHPVPNRCAAPCGNNYGKPCIPYDSKEKVAAAAGVRDYVTATDMWLKFASRSWVPTLLDPPHAKLSRWSHAHLCKSGVTNSVGPTATEQDGTSIVFSGWRRVISGSKHIKGGG